MKVLIAVFLAAAFLGAACGSTSSGGNDGGGGSSGAAGTGGGGAGGAIACALDAGGCPAGYRCGCGGPGPAANCTCHKECSSDLECDAQNPMCGCLPTDPAPRICVNACFCTCR